MDLSERVLDSSLDVAWIYFVAVILKKVFPVFLPGVARML